MHDQRTSLGVLFVDQLLTTLHAGSRPGGRGGTRQATQSITHRQDALTAKAECSRPVSSPAGACYNVPGGNRRGRNSGTLGQTMSTASTSSIGTSMIRVSFKASTMRILATAQAIIRHNP